MLRLAMLIPLLINVLRVSLYIHAGKIVVGILGFLGLNFVAHTYVIEPGLDYMRSLMGTGPGGEFGAYAMNWMGILRFDQAVSMMLSAWVIVQTIKSGRTLLGKVTS